MEFISNCTADAIANAAKALKDGHLVAFPTETVYGLGADATNEKAVSRIYSVKGRPSDHPLIVHISSINKLDDWATNIPDYAIKLAREFWPGPMTLILPRKDIAKDFITGGQNNVGLRVPAQPIALALLNKFEDLGGHGVAAPSANRFGAVSPTSSKAVEEELGDYFDSSDLVLDGGPCLVGIESTIIDCSTSEPHILRPGAITYEMLQEHLKILPNSNYANTKTRTPGNLKEHYAPETKVFLNSTPKANDGLIALSSVTTPEGVVRLASPNTVEEFAQQLYGSLRYGDSLNLNSIVVITPKGNGLATALNDRLKKSSYKSFKEEL
jgi:L-threonylcarbamoyladenylate synthase